MRCGVTWSVCFMMVATAQVADIRERVESGGGRAVAIPDGTYEIDTPLMIRADNTRLYGHATIVQTNPDADIIRVENAKGVRIQGLTLTRAAGKQDATGSAVRAENCTRLELAELRVLDNWSQAGTIFLDRCESSVVRDCEVVNYKRIGVDDRTASELYGYAFRAIDGTGILVTNSGGVQVIDNRVLEERLYATRETKEQHQLGQFCEGKNPTQKGKLAPQGDYANNWHQGSAITVSSPETTHHVLI